MCPPKTPYQCLHEDCENQQMTGFWYCPQHVVEKYGSIPFDAEPNDDVIMWAERDGERNVPADPTWARDVEARKRRRDEMELRGWLDTPEDEG